MLHAIRAGFIIGQWREASQFRRQVEALLARAYHTSVSLKHPQFMPSRPDVCRFGVKEGPAEIGSSLVVKRLRKDEMKLAETTSSPLTRYLFFNEYAGLKFLTQETNATSVSPRLFAGDRSIGFLVIEDLKPDSDVGTCLYKRDPMQAEEKLLLWGSVLGKLHASTTGKQAAFNNIRDALIPHHSSWGWVPPWQRKPKTYEKLLQTLPVDIRQAGFESFQWMRFALRQVTNYLSLPVPPLAEAELEIVIQALHLPGPFLAYTHGDPCPDNCLIHENTAKFVDFENGDYRHALVDAVYTRLCFPTCWSAQQLPHESIMRIEHTYRAELVKGCPEAADDQIFTHELVHACAYWVLMLCQFDAIAHFTARDKSWGLFTMRQRILTRFELFAQTTAEFRHLEALGSLFHIIASTLRSRWPARTQQLPLFPAFRREA
ncbi:MAG: phosphotransferase [Ktedonobacteraceae bacterium]